MKNKVEVRLKNILDNFNAKNEHDDYFITGKTDLFLNENIR